MAFIILPFRHGSALKNIKFQLFNPKRSKGLIDSFRFVFF